VASALVDRTLNRMVPCNNGSAKGKPRDARHQRSPLEKWSLGSHRCGPKVRRTISVWTGTSA